mmetsp:Transcript_26459/g.25333  ORF Transcript_26459/g.25333 Transcript_26459/m.25333 type:complete len:372 (-) Transcript_26459:49-1164(-)
MAPSEVIVQAGETLISISVRENVNINLLRRANGLYGNEIYSGQVLQIPGKEITPTNNQSVPNIPISEEKIISEEKNIIPEVKQIIPSTNELKKETRNKDSDIPISRKEIQSNDIDDIVLKEEVKSTGNSPSLLTRIRGMSIPPIQALRIRALSSPPSPIPVLTVPLISAERKRQQEKEQFDKIPPTLIGDKKILCHEKAKKLRCFLPTMQQFESWKLLYSVLNDGADLGSFFRRTKNHKYTLTIVETMNGEIFGGFNSVEWLPATIKFYGSGESFIFKFDSEDNIEHYPWSGANDFFVWSSHERIAMGGGGDGFAFVLDSDFRTGESYRCATYGNPVLVDKEKGSFEIANVESWGFEGLFGRVTKSTRQNA